MKMPRDRSTDAAELRRRAEEQLREKRASQRSKAEDSRGAIDSARLIYELEVHQVELEIQNEELLRARAEKEELLAQYTDLYEFAPAGYLIFDRDGAIRQVNLTGARLLGLERSRLVGARFDQFVAESERRIFSDFLQRVSASEAMECCEVTLPQAGARPLIVRIEGTRSSDGRECHAVMLDITAHRHAEEKLARFNQHHELILRSAAEGILGLDTQGNHTFVNPAAARMLGYEAEELLDRPSHDTWHHTKADGSPCHRDECQIYAAYRDGVVRRESAEVFWRKDGTSFPVEYASTPLHEQGRLAGAVVTFTDITERLRSAEERVGLEDRLRQSQKVEAIGQLAGGVAHDFNNFAAIVLGYGELLLSRFPPGEPARKWVEQIVEAGRRSATLTRQLLAFSRKQTLQPEVLDLNALFGNLETMLSRLIGENIDLDLRPAADLGFVRADPGQLEQVIANLVINARDAMPHGGRLVVETGNVDLDETYALSHESVVPGRYVMLALSDTGCGMDKATMARMFDPFFTTKPPGKGTGLGLATAYGIVKQSDGYIWAYSEPGQGTIFRIYLPRADAEPEAMAGGTGGAGAEALKGCGERILLVEDEMSLRELCGTVLSRLGYRVSAVTNGQEGLLLVQERGLEPDLVVTDVIMPGIGGAEMADRLRKDRPGLKVLFMSGYPDDAIAPHGVLKPGTPFIQKPFTEQALAAKVREALGGAAAGRPGRRVLMIDDDEQFRDLVRHFCAKRDYVFAGVDSAAAALEALAGQSFDVLLVDLNLPGTDGAQVLREIRAAGHAAPAIVLTGDVASADLGVLSPLGVLRALEKSGKSEPLLQAIEEAGRPGASPGDGGDG